MNTFRNMGYFVDSLLADDKSKRTEFCKILNFSETDLNRLCEGRIGLTPTQLEKTASFFNKNIQDFINYSNTDFYANQVHCRTNFNNISNCDKILDIIDSYIDIKEAL